MRQQNNNMHNNAAFELCRAAANNDIETMNRVLSMGANPNAYVFNNNQYSTALHAAVYSRHYEAVQLLLEHRADRYAPDSNNQTPIDINSQMRDQRIFALLNPECVQESQIRINQFSELQRSYRCSSQNNPQTSEESLYVLGDNYNQNERVPDDLGLETVLSYMIDAIIYIHIMVYEAEKYHADSDERWNHDTRVLRMLKALAACSHCLRKYHPAIINRSPGINWEGLALIIRVQHYNPSFLGSLIYIDKLLRVAVHDLVLSKELENLQNVVRFLRDNPEYRQDVDVTPKLSRFDGFFRDQYYAEYIEDAIKNFMMFLQSRSPHDNRVALLRSLMIIGEALHHSSPIIRTLFYPTDVENTIRIRDILCHPERPRNGRIIENVLNGIETINFPDHSVPVNLFRLMQNLMTRYGVIQSYLSLYNQNFLPQYIWGRISNIHLSLPPNTNSSSNASSSSKQESHIAKTNFHKLKENFEFEKSKNPVGNLEQEFLENLRQRFSYLESIPTQERTSLEIKELHEIQRHFYELNHSKELKSLQQEFKNWVETNDPHKDKRVSKSRLEDPKKNVSSMKEVLADNKDKYEAAKQKTSSLNKEEKKLIKDYEGITNKLTEWQKYAAKLDDLEQQRESYINNLKHEEYELIKKKTIKLVEAYLIAATKVEEFFTRLSDFNYVRSTSQNYTSRGFSSHPERHLLEFYQIMVGSYARNLLDNEIFGLNTNPDLTSILANDNKTSRGYLAHLGARQEGTTLMESTSSPRVFDTNPRSTIAAKPKMEKVRDMIRQTRREEYEALSRIIGPSSLYGDNELNIIVRQSLPQNTDLVETAISQIPEQLKVRLNDFITSNNYQQLAIPLHIGDQDRGHFVALHVRRVGLTFEITYFDPMATNPIPQATLDIIRNVFGQNQQITSTINIIQTFSIINGEQVADNNHCGAFVAHILSELSNNNMRVNHNNSRLEERINNHYQDLANYTPSNSDNLGRSIRTIHTELYRNYLVTSQIQGLSLGNQNTNSQNSPRTSPRNSGANARSNMRL
jgi:hypothetical protein